MVSQARISCEFFPPKTEAGKEKLIQVSCELEKLTPEYFSMTCGALGADRYKSREFIDLLLENTSVPIMPHITCIGSVKDEVIETLTEYKAKGIKNLVALRGDKPIDASNVKSDFNHANDLVSFIKEKFGNDFRIAVAAYPEGHPESKNAETDLFNFKRKVDAGADFAITQYFFDANVYINFLEKCKKLGIKIPVIPGIITIRDWKQVLKFSEACGAHFPAWLIEKFLSFGDDEISINNFSCDLLVEHCKKLLVAGAPQLHFYSLNHADLVTKICERLEPVA